MYKAIATYCKESYNELVHKVTWTSRKELISSAVVVLSASIIIALLVWVMDSIFELIMKVVYSWF